jgi:glutamine synthetase
MILVIGLKPPFIIYIFCLFAHIRIYKLDEFGEVLSAIEAACQLQNIPTTSMTSEYGAGQFEVNLQHQDDVLQAADHAVLLRRAIQGVSRLLGYDATFMSKPFSGQSGNGMHIHLSLSE